MDRRRFLKRSTLCTSAIGIAQIIDPGALGLTAPGGNVRQLPQDLGEPPLHTVPPDAVDLSEAVILSRPGNLPHAERTAAKVLVEEVEKRTGLRLETSADWPAAKPVIAITSVDSVPAWRHSIPAREGADLPEKRPDGYRLYFAGEESQPVVWIIGADPRGALYGVGNLLRRLEWEKGKLALAPQVDIATAPAFSIRGHQLGYRPQANSYDAWDPAQFEQYIRELTFFGANSIEGIPFQDTRKTPVMKFSRRFMNRAIGEICQRYGLDYWVWAPADFDLRNQALRQEALQKIDQFFKDTPVLTGYFVAGGDPGDNPPELVFPFLEDVAKLLSTTHPKAKVWFSVQQFKPAEVEYTYNYIERNMPSWFGGLVAGPSSPPMREMRERLPARYELRDYPDLTHNKLCQYEVPEWDQAYALTEGREAVNPRPAEYAAIFGHFSGYTNGFISYSDGVHDDVNKTIWSALSWDPNRHPRDILIDYARVYFKPAVSERAANAIQSLENNWRGPLINSGAVEGTFLEWRRLEQAAPELESNWRWQMYLLRTNYDVYIRRRLINETALESEANAIMADSKKIGPAKAMSDAMAVLNRCKTRPVSSDVRARIFDLCAELFHSIGLQTSVKKYYAIGEERGAVLDFVNYPLNNRWWLEDQFKAIRALASESEQNQRLHELATWEHPGSGSFYDDVGNTSKSPRVVRCDPEFSPQLKRHPGPTFWWWDSGRSRARLTWQVTMFPTAMVYEALDPTAAYVVRSTGYGNPLLQINGDRVEPTVKGSQKMGEFKEFPVPAEVVKSRRLVLNWDRPTDEGNLNWRYKSRLSEVWLLKKA